MLGSQFKIYRSGRTDQEHRKFLKLSFLLRLGRVDFNFIVNAISIFFNIEKHRIQIFDYNSDKNIKVRHIKLRILKKVNIREIILFLKSIKAAGIIIDCWEMLDGEFLINCKGEKQKYIVKSDVRYEYDRHEYNLDEMLELND